MLVCFVGVMSNEETVIHGNVTPSEYNDNIPYTLAT